MISRTAFPYAWYLVFVFAVLGVTLLPASPQAQAAFGVSPPFIHADKLVPGSKYSQTIHLVRDVADADLPMTARLDIAERVRSWVSIDKGYAFTIPAGVRQFPITITVSAPKNADRVAYEGTLEFTSAPPKEGQITIALGVQVILNIRVGDDIFRQYSIPIVKPLDIEEGWNPRVLVRFNNEGNIPESLDAAVFELQDKYGGATLAYTQRTRDFPEADPFTTKEFVVEFPIALHLGLGQYWGQVTLFKEDKSVGGNRATFQVLPKGSLSTLTERTLRHFAGNWKYYAGALLVLATASILWRARRRQKTETPIS